MEDQRKKYDRTFKENAVKLSYERKNVSELSRELGITAALLYRWRKEYAIKGSNSFPGNGNVAVTDEAKELIHVKKQLREKEIENEILKKALSIISGSDR